MACSCITENPPQSYPLIHHGVPSMSLDTMQPHIYHLGVDNVLLLDRLNLL